MPPAIPSCASFCARTSWRYPKSGGSAGGAPAVGAKRVAGIHPWVWHNGERVAGAGLRLSPWQAGLLTGWGLFSTLRIYQGVPFAWEDHWARLAADAAQLHVDTAGLRELAERGLAELVAANAAPEAVARIYLIRNHGGLLAPPAGGAGSRPTDLLLVTLPLRAWRPRAALRLQPHGRHAQAPLARTKTLTWSHNLVLVEAANAAGFDDVLLLNERGEVAECTSANVFVARAGRLFTPPLDSGALPGVSRKVLLEAAPRHGLAIAEAVLREADLRAADEIFITSTTRVVQPVERVDGWSVPQGPLASRAALALRAEVARYLAAHTPPLRPETGQVHA